LAASHFLFLRPLVCCGEKEAGAILLEPRGGGRRHECVYQFSNSSTRPRTKQRVYMYLSTSFTFVRHGIRSSDSYAIEAQRKDPVYDATFVRHSRMACVPVSPFSDLLKETFTFFSQIYPHVHAYHAAMKAVTVLPLFVACLVVKTTFSFLPCPLPMTR
jgi:hypothetical protein